MELYISFTPFLMNVLMMHMWRGLLFRSPLKIKGKVINVYVDDNQYVEAGKPLLEIYQQDYLDLAKKKKSIFRLISEENEQAATIEEKEKTLTKVRANLDVALSEEDLAQKEVQRYESLLKKDAVSQNEYDQMKSRWQATVARSKASVAAIGEAEAAIKAIKAKYATQSFKIKEAQSTKNLADLI